MEPHERHYDADYAHEPVTIGAPPAGSGFTYNVPGASRQRIVAITFQLDTDANAANRTPFISYANAAGGSFFTVASPFVVTASHSSIFSFAVGMQQFGANNALVIGAPLPAFAMAPGLGLSVALINGQAGDQLSEISLFVDQWPVRD